MSKAVVVLVLLVVIAGAAYLAYNNGLIEVNVSIRTGTSTAATQQAQGTPVPTTKPTTVPPPKTTTSPPRTTAAATTTTTRHTATTTTRPETATKPATTTTRTSTATTTATRTATAKPTATATTAAAQALPEPWNTLKLPRITVMDKMMDEGPRIMMVIEKPEEPRIQPLSHERTPYIADYRDDADFYAAGGMGFLGPSYAILMTTVSPIGYLDNLYLGKEAAPFTVVFFPEKVRDAVFLDNGGYEWLILTTKGDLVYGAVGKRLNIPKQLASNVSEARALACAHRLYSDPGLSHVGAFRSMYMDAAIAWGGNKLVLIPVNNYAGFAIGCKEEPKTAYVKTITFPEEIVWAGQFDSPTILWILTTKKLYAMPLVSYKFQTAWLRVSPEKLHPVPVADSKPFVVMAVSTGDALVMLLDKGGIEAKLIENEWEGVAKVSDASVRLEGVEIQQGGKKPVKLMIEWPVANDRPLLALQYPGEIVIYSFDEDGAQKGVINATREVSYTLGEGDNVVGYTAVLLHGAKRYNQATKERYGAELGENVFISGIVVVTPDNKLVGVLDYEGRS